MFKKMLYVISVTCLALLAFNPGGVLKAQAKSGKVPIFSNGFESGNFQPGLPVLSMQATWLSPPRRPCMGSKECAP
jgi:hypothetical protein